MKIAFLSRYQNIHQRGAETFVKELSLRLSKNHKVDILSGKESDSLNKVLDGKYDVVVPINGRMQSLKMSLGRLFGKYNRFTSCNASHYKLLISGHSGIGRDDIWNIAVARPDIFVALTDYMATWAKSWAWGSKVVKIPNGIDINKFSQEGDKLNIDLPGPIILSVGALTWYKYHDRVIRAIGEMGKGSLLIVGAGPEKEELNKLGKLVLKDRFKICEFGYGDMPKVYRSCDLFTLPSWEREAFGIAYLEALASGLGVVAPNDSSRREIVGEAGLYTDVSDSTKYAQALTRALNLDWQKKARNQAKKFSWEKVASEYEKVMLSLIG